MIKEFKTDKGEFLANLLPDDAELIGRMDDEFWSYQSKSKGWGKFKVKGKYEIIDFLSKITEEQAKEVVSKIMIDKYENYTVNSKGNQVTQYFEYLFDTALESFNSLMQANEIDLNTNQLILKRCYEFTNYE